jgi:capsular exopolysaccharide synthesis family protein
MHTVLVTSPSAGDGKTSTVVNLGAVFAQAGSRVVVVSCDLRRPGLSQFFAPAENSELTKVLSGSQQVKRAVTKVADVDGLWTLSTKGIVDNPTELLAGDRMRSVLEELAGQFDVVLIDSPPVLPVADAVILSEYADAVLVVVAAGQTRRAELRRTRDKLLQAGAPPVGAVLNKATARDGYGYYGGYQPYVLPRSVPLNSAALDGVPRGGAADGGHDKQNGHRLPSGQPGRSGL